MDAALQRRTEIYDHLQPSAACHEYFFAPVRGDEYATYYTSMFLLQDSGQSLCAHRQRGFSVDPLVAYLECWGVMQAVIISQDAIRELHVVIVGAHFDAGTRDSAWSRIRLLRNICAGHPAKKDRGASTTRSFVGRGPLTYDYLQYERWEDGGGTTRPVVNLGNMLDAYTVEAEAHLSLILATMKRRWP